MLPAKDDAGRTDAGVFDQLRLLLLSLQRAVALPAALSVRVHRVYFSGDGKKKVRGAICSAKMALRRTNVSISRWGSSSCSR